MFKEQWLDNPGIVESNPTKGEINIFKTPWCYRNKCKLYQLTIATQFQYGRKDHPVSYFQPEYFIQ